MHTSLCMDTWTHTWQYTHEHTHIHSCTLVDKTIPCLSLKDTPRWQQPHTSSELEAMTVTKCNRVPSWHSSSSQPHDTKRCLAGFKNESQRRAGGGPGKVGVRLLPETEHQHCYSFSPTAFVRKRAWWYPEAETESPTLGSHILHDDLYSPSYFGPPACLTHFSHSKRKQGLTLGQTVTFHSQLGSSALHTKIFSQRHNP